jgi:hypothetical protein
MSVIAIKLQVTPHFAQTELYPNSYGACLLSQQTIVFNALFFSVFFALAGNQTEELNCLE